MTSQCSPIHHIVTSVLADNVLIDLAKKYKTPLYIYDKEVIKKNYKNLCDNFNYRIYYAVKSNPFGGVLKLFNALGAYFEVASYGELLKLKENSICLSKALFVGPAKKERDLLFALENGIGLIAVESQQELIRIQKLAKYLNKKVEVLLRINLGINAGAMLNMSGISQFGIDSETLSAILENSYNYQAVDIVGLHFYLGKNILDEQQILSNIKNILLTCLEIEQIHHKTFQFIDIGGGFGIPYYEKDKAINLSRLANQINLLLDEYKKSLAATILMEYGRFLVAEAGVFITEVIDIKNAFGKKFVILDGGTNFFGGDNKYRGFRIPPLKALNAQSNKQEIVTLVGSLCTPSDILANEVLLPELGIGDFIAFYQAGAYSFTASPVLFLSHVLPQEILV